MNDSQNLGTVSTWQIKNFPDGLRRAIVERAGVEKITVGELLTRITVAVIESDWQVGGAVNPSYTRSTPDLAALLQAAGPFTADNPMPGQVRSLINDMARSARSPRVVRPGHTNRMARIGAGVETAEGVGHAE